MSAGTRRGLSAQERETCAALRNEIGPPKKHDHLRQPMVSAEEVRRLLDCIARLDDVAWPARAYVYGTWGYALSRARDLSADMNEKTYLYSGTLDGESVWVVAWDPKRVAS